MTMPPMDLQPRPAAGYAWHEVDPIIKPWAAEREFTPNSRAGSWGPGEPNRLFDPGRSGKIRSGATALIRSHFNKRP